MRERHHVNMKGARMARNQMDTVENTPVMFIEKQQPLNTVMWHVDVLIHVKKGGVDVRNVWKILERQTINAI
jgi:hypothetical protein